MNNKMDYSLEFIGIRLGVIVLAIFTGIVIYSYLIYPYVLEPICLVNTNSCIRIAYYSFKNSALAHMRNSGIWVWYNGYKAFVFGQNVGNICAEKDGTTKYEPAYAINTSTGEKEGYECVTPLESLIDYYKQRGKMKFIYTRVNDRENFDVYDVLNMLKNKNIIVF